MKPNVMKETAQLRLHDNEKNTHAIMYTKKVTNILQNILHYRKEIYYTVRGCQLDCTVFQSTASCRQFGGTARKKEIN